jgi:glycosyltransferase involved in cell wall biosynthesis
MHGQMSSTTERTALGDAASESQEQRAQETTAERQLRIGILVVAYNAESTLASVLDRVPKDFWPRVSQVFVNDDASGDSTYLVGLGYQQLVNDLPLRITRHPENLGYGGNQKAGYRMAIDAGLDIIVMLHGDGQYAPECIAEIVAPLERGEADAVFGSRMMVPGAAREGGMPLYKYVGNRILTEFENRMLGTSLSEFHSGYRAYRVDALKAIPFERNSDNFNFDTQIIVQLVDAGKRIVEVPIPTFYGDEICYVNGMKYARDVSGDVIKYRLEKLGFGAGDFGAVETAEEFEKTDSANRTILRWLEHKPRSKVLVLGGTNPNLGDQAQSLGHSVTVARPGASAAEHPGVERVLDVDLDHGIPESVSAQGTFDMVVCAEALERVRDPELLLKQIRGLLAPGGVLIVSAPNFGHWYPRFRTALGLFDYDQRGVLSAAHIRLFTRRGLLYRLRGAGFTVVNQDSTGLPLDILARVGGRVPGVLRILDRILVTLRPTLFGYQMVFMCQPSVPLADHQ